MAKYHAGPITVQASRDIPLDEWEAHEWIDVRHLRHQGPLFMKRVKPEGPPDDGFAYVRDGDQWVRAQTIDPLPARPSQGETPA